MNRFTVMKNYRLLAPMLFAMVAGYVAGWFFPEFGHFIKPVGTVFINMMFCVVVLLVFASTSNSMVSVHSRKRADKIMGAAMLTFVVTGTVAVVIVFIATKLVLPVLEPWADMATEAIGKHTSLINMIANFFITDDFMGLLNRSAMLLLIVLSILFGFATNLVGGPDHIIGKLLDGLIGVMTAFVRIITHYASTVLFALFADLVATYGSSAASTYGRAMVVYYPLCFTYIFAAPSLFAYIGGGRYGTKTMFQYIVGPVTTPLGTRSSPAAIPTNLYEAEDTSIPKDVANMVVPMSATVHMDNPYFSCVLRIAFILGTMGVDMPQTMFPAVVVVAVPPSVDMSGAPGGGCIGEYIIYSIFLPQQIEVVFPILVVIGNLVDPLITMIDSAGDCVVCYIVARATDGRDWLNRVIAAKHAKQHPPEALCRTGYLPEKQRGSET